MTNFQGVQGGVGYNDTVSDQDSRRRQQLAQLMLQQSNAAPAVGWTGALNKVLAGAIAGYQMNKDGDEQKARGDARNDTLARALSAGQGQAAETKAYGDGTTIDWNERKADPNAMAAILAGNRDTAPMGLQMQIGQMDERRKSEAALAAELRKTQTDRENEFYKPIKTDDGSIIIPALMPGFQMPGQAPPTAAPQAPGGGVDMASAAPNPPPVERQPMSHTPGYATNVTGIENNTGDPAARNRRSSAMGNGQFINATWLDIVKRNRPDIAQGKSDQDILALRADPKLSAEMTDVYGTENADELRAGGIQTVGDAEKYAAHFFGPSGAIKVLQADPNASFASVLSPEAIKANPQLARMTVGQWRQQNAAKFGGGQPPAQDVQAAPAAPPNQPGVLYQGRGEGGPFVGPAAAQQNRNLWIKLQTKVANGETLTPQEQLSMELLQQDAQQQRTIVTDRGVETVTPPPLPTMGGHAPVTVPNPLPPAAAPPAPAAQSTVTLVSPKAAKPIPEGIQKGMSENVSAVRKIEDAIEAITKAPDATGAVVGGINQVMPNAVTNFMFPEGVNARALIADIGSLKIHDRSGAAVSVSEFPRLAPFVPSASDSPDVIKMKLENFRREYINALNDANSEYGADKGYSANSSVVETLKNGRTPRYKAPLPGEDPNKPKSAASGLSNADILKNLGL